MTEPINGPDAIRWRKQVLLVGLLALTLHLVFAFGFARFFPELSDKQIHDQGFEIAVNLAQGRGYRYNWFGLEYQAWRPPVFPFLLTPGVWLFGPTWAPAKVMLSCFGAGTAMLACVLGRRLFDARIGLIAGVVTAIDPSLVMSSAWPEPSNLSAFLMLLGCLMLLRTRDGGLKDAALAGLLMGFTVLAKTFYLLWPIFAAIFLLLQKGDLKRKLQKAAVIGAVTIAVASPWAIRNYMVFNTPRLTTTDTSLVLWVANCKSWITQGVGEGKLPPVEFASTYPIIKDMGEIERDKWLMNDALTTISENKGAYVKRSLERIWLIWKPFKYAPVWTPAAIAKGVFMFLSFGPILFFFLASVVVLRKEWRTLSLFYLLILGLTGGLAFVHGVSRYRVPLEPMLIIQGAYLMSRVLDRWKIWRVPTAAPAAPAPATDRATS